jgi:hypothetical protein
MRSNTRGFTCTCRIKSRKQYFRHEPITNTTWVHARLCKLQKGCTRLAAASDKVYQLLAQGQWFSPGSPASSTTKTGRHDNMKEHFYVFFLKSGVFFYAILNFQMSFH